MQNSLFAIGLIFLTASCQWIADIDEKSSVSGPGGASPSASAASASSAGGCGQGSGGSAGTDACLMTCEGVCVNSLTDAGHCGSCNVVCPCGVTCDGGICGRSLYRGVDSDSPCAVSAGTLYCWGANDDYQGGFADMVSPVTFPSPATVLESNVRYAASSWDATCALLTNGGVACFGANSNGELGNGSIGGPEACSDGTCVKKAVSTIDSGIDEIAGAGSFIGGAHFCARTTSGKVLCWGKLAGSAPTEVVDDIVQITSGVGFDCALRATGTVACWGSNAHGQLGQGDFAAHSGVVDVPKLAGVTTIGAGASHVCARAGDELHCWGGNTFAQLGNGSLDGKDISSPTLVVAPKGLEDVVQISGALEATCALTSKGLVFCWGRGDFGLLGSGKDVGTPCTNNSLCMPVPIKASLAGVVEIALGGTAGLARDAEDAVYTWGSNSAGQLGNGKTSSPNLPTKITLAP